MRTQLCWIPLAVAATLMGKLVLPAQDWQTVDDFALAGGNAGAAGVAADAAGRIYVVGTANGHGIVRYSADGGSNWITRDDFVYPATNNAFNAVTVDYQGSVFVGGGGGGHWLVRRSTDQGVTWETVDDFYKPRIGPGDEGIYGALYSLASDGHGRVYGAGPGWPTDAGSYPLWLVRGSGVGGTNWETKLSRFEGYSAIAQITCAEEDVYVTGVIDTDEDRPDWLMLRSSDHGATWTTNFESRGDLLSAITGDAAGYLYTAGAHGINATSVVWLVRQAAPGGTNWTTLDRVLYDANAHPFANLVLAGWNSSIAVDVGGNVCATGQFVDYWGTTWFTRQYLVADGQWRTTDLFSYSTNMDGAATGTAIAPSGSVFVVGYGTSDSGQRRWVVRKRAAPTPVELAHALEKQVNDLLARSAIAREPASMLLAILDRIVAEMEQGKSAPVCNRLRTFSEMVQQFVNQSTLAQSDGELLVNGTANLRLILGCRE